VSGETKMGEKFPGLSGTRLDWADLGPAFEGPDSLIRHWAYTVVVARWLERGGTKTRPAGQNSPKGPKGGGPKKKKNKKKGSRGRTFRAKQICKLAVEGGKFAERTSVDISLESKLAISGSGATRRKLFARNSRSRSLRS